MTKRNRLLVFFSACFLLSISLFVSQIFAVADANLKLESVNSVENEYSFGTVFYLPEYEFSLSGEQETSSSVLI